MRLLIVDDEQFAVEGLLYCCDWKAFGIEEVLTENRADRARDIVNDKK